MNLTVYDIFKIIYAFREIGFNPIVNIGVRYSTKHRFLGLYYIAIKGPKGVTIPLVKSGLNLDSKRLDNTRELETLQKGLNAVDVYEIVGDTSDDIQNGINRLKSL